MLTEQTDFDKFKTAVKHNSWFAHPEMIILALLGDSDASKRELGVKLIKKTRSSSGEPQRGLRDFKKPAAAVNFDATSYDKINKRFERH